MIPYIKSRNMYISIGIAAIGVLSYLAIMDVFDFTSRTDEDHDADSRR